MKRTALVLTLSIVWSATACAQDIDKELAFAQIAAGPGLNSVLNIANRGTTTYTGSFNLFTMSADGSSSLAWNPTINGTATTNGQLAISIPAGNTQTLTITAPSLQVGFGTITPTGSSSTDDSSFLEGDLTYYFMSGQTVTDSVGVGPSAQIYLTSIPFDNFSNIALALANANSSASVQLTLYSDSGSVANQTLSMAQNAHVAKYLSEIFPGVQLTGGRLDILSQTYIYGIALTQAGSQFSSLPFDAANKMFNWTINFTPTSTTWTGTLNARLVGSLVDFHVTTLTKNGQPISEPDAYLSGTYINGVGTVMDYSEALNQIQYWTLSSFSLQPTNNGTVQIWSISPFAYLGQGQVTLVPAN